MVCQSPEMKVIRVARVIAQELLLGLGCVSADTAKTCDAKAVFYV
jgi:hypothetical protein